MGRAAACWVLVLVACAAPRPEAFAPLATAARAPGSVAVLLGPAPPPPHRVDRVVVMLDGELVDDERLPVVSHVLARYPSLPRGDHTLTVRFLVSRPCVPLGDARETVELRAASTFVLDGHAAVVEARLLEDPTLTQEEGSLRVLFRHHGTAEDPTQVAAPWNDLDALSCLSLAEPARSLCRVQAGIAQARAARDIVWLICLNEKRQALAELAADLVEQPDSPATHARTLSRVREVMQEAQSCIGFEMAWAGPSQNERIVSACEGPDPFDDPETVTRD